MNNTDGEKNNKKVLDEVFSNQLDSDANGEEVVLQNLAKKVGVPYVDLRRYVMDDKLASRLPEKHARRFKAILLNEEDGKYLVGMVDPSDIFATDYLYSVLNKPIKRALVDKKELNYKLDQLYRRADEITNFVGKLTSELSSSKKNKTNNTVKINETEKTEPVVIKLIRSVFADAVQVNASDIHIEPGENILRIRLRVDGVLQEQIIPLEDKSNTALAVAQRLKLMAGLNIAEKRLPQDGRFETVVRDMKIEVRLSTMPTKFGESVVMRLLNKSQKGLDLDSIGMPAEMLKRFRQLIRVPQGMVLVTGPTGSGKTTTLYAALSEISDIEKNIVTIEDPVEYVINRANQVQVNPQIGLTFARILRSVLRQDPDVILVGEVRDQETASIALRSALTGHLVFATLHTNDAASSIIRLVDIGVESYLVAATVRAIVAQRLVRKICPACSTDYKPTADEVAFFTPLFGDKFTDSVFKYGVGCSHCGFTGFNGRIGVFELLELDSEMRDVLSHKDTGDFIETVNKNRKSPGLLTSAFDMARDNVITLSEVMRIVGDHI